MSKDIFTNSVIGAYISSISAKLSKSLMTSKNFEEVEK